MNEPRQLEAGARAIRVRRFALIVGVALLLLPAAADADSGGATISSLPESSNVQVFAEVSHQCAGEESCVWFAAATAYSASSGCPMVFDGSHGVWQSPLEKYPIKTVGSFAVNTAALESTIVVCLYVYSEGTFSLVGQSHPFNVQTGREVLPEPPETRTPEASLKGLRACEREGRNGAFLDASPSVACRTARLVQRDLFRRPCEARTFCVVAGFRCYGRYGGLNRPFWLAHHASCRAGRRRIVLDTG
jgi:hypothetical protein